jgi:hypothetical protein
MEIGARNIWQTTLMLDQCFANVRLSLFRTLLKSGLSVLWIFTFAAD